MPIFPIALISSIVLFMESYPRKERESPDYKCTLIELEQKVVLKNQKSLPY